uniref:Golgi apparatus membrane protein TVP38 n=1 Tax=Tetradesmus obliquus TaxID=3088 RepID=A0A383W526_TETOB|eukprot:jgi/Sobl393_1/1516/SZX72242.1
MPRLQAHELHALVHNFPPSSLPAVITLRDTLLAYAETYPKTVAVGILMLYSIMQTFAIPGTISLSLLSGALYGSTRGFLLVAAVSTAGSCSCYGMSCLLWRPIARAVWADRIEGFKSEVAKRRHDLLSYIIFLRVTPMLPNVFINVASPIVGVPLLDWGAWGLVGGGWWGGGGTLIGCAPNNFMAAHAGDHLSDLDSLADLYNPRMLLLGLTVGCIALLPVYMKHRHDKERAIAMLAQKIR